MNEGLGRSGGLYWPGGCSAALSWKGELVGKPFHLTITCAQNGKTCLCTLTITCRRATVGHLHSQTWMTILNLCNKNEWELDIWAVKMAADESDQMYTFPDSLGIAFHLTVTCAQNVKQKKKTDYWHNHVQKTAKEHIIINLSSQKNRYFYFIWAVKMVHNWAFEQSKVAGTPCRRRAVASQAAYTPVSNKTKIKLKLTRWFLEAYHLLAMLPFSSPFHFHLRNNGT